MHHTPTSLKLLALGSLTLAIKMDDAEMVTKFCLNYVYSPERTIKRNTSNQQFKAKKDDPKDLRSKVGQILSNKISEDKKNTKEDFTLEEIFEY